MTRSAAREYAALLLLLAAGSFSLLAGGRSRVVPATAPATAFSAERAMRDLRAIARRPHPVGTVEHDRVRDYITDRLRSVGCGDVHVQSATGFNTLDGPIAATVANVVCRIRGRRDGSALLLTAHYDGVPRAPAAGDDAAGVAAVIETIRAIAAGGQPDREVMVVISDAEEAGLLGAEAFVDLHPWARDVAVVLNFDNRGDRGPVYMFQTSPGNDALIAALAHSVPGARANSLTGDVYRLLPSDTDLSIWLHSAFPVGAYNFAVVGGYTHYHTPIDDVSSLDPRVVQQMGDYALGLTHALDHSAVGDWRTHDDVYFDAPLLGIVRYPGSWALPLAVAALLATAGFAATALWHRRASPAGLLHGAVAVGLGVLVPSLLTAALWRLIWWLHPGYREILQRDPYNSLWYLGAFAAMTLAIAIRVQRRFARLTTPLDRAIAAMLPWAILGVIAAVALPGATYLLLWPLVAAIVVAAAWLRRAEPPGPSPLIALLALPALILWLPLIVALEVGLTAQMLPVCIAMLALVITLLDPAIALAGGRRPALSVAAAIVALAALMVAESRSGFTATRKRPDSLAYLEDAGLHRAWWISFDRAPDAWTVHALGPAPGRRAFDAQRLGSPGDSFLAAPAPVSDFLSPVRALTVDSGPALHRVHLNLVPSGDSEELDVYVDADTVTGMTVNGRTLPDGSADRYHPEYHAARHGTVLRYFGVPADGIDLTFTVHTTRIPAIRVSATWEGLPPTQAGALPPRPDGIMSKPFIPTDVTIAQWEPKP